uniref:Fibronectin type-III domain-containing protein n=1 Tax=Xiphophorus couchianus TaxID=32473 RepID=A0A3B5MJ13_9TELE
TNVQVTSRNLNLILSWDPPAEAPSGLIYTTEFNSIGIRNPGCVNITTFQCELSNFGISPYGTYSGKVRALLGEEASAWAETLISPPSVSLLPIGQTLEISIKEPEFYISSLRSMYSKVSYNITYWKDDQEMIKVEFVLISCSEVEKFSRPITVSVSDNSPMVAAVIVCVVIAVAVVMTVLAVVKWKSISHFLWPKVSLPRHFEKSLLATPESSVYLITQPTEEIAPVSVVTVEEGSPERTKESSYNKQLNGTVGDSCLPGD